MLLSVSLELLEPAVTVRPSADTMPDVTVGVPAASPSALPIATTASPTTRSFESPKVTGVNPAMLLMRMRATSSMGLVPTSVAGNALVEPVRVTVIVPPFTAAAITWLLVMTRPFFVMTMPVP